MEAQAADKAPTFTVIADRTIQGALAMFFRHALLVPVGLLANILLARWLTPADFGAYAIANFLIATATQFSDFGLAAALIQKRESPTRVELRTVFTVRLALSFALVLLLLGLTPELARIFHLNESTSRVIPWLALVLPLGTLGSISMMLLERALAYPSLARIEVLATVVFQVTALALAYWGCGVWSFIVGALVGEGVRAISLCARAFWPMGLTWDVSVLRASLRFGAPFQLGVWTSLLRDHMASLLAGPLFGPRAVGFLNWAHGMAYQTSQVFTQAISRVSFPSLSRVREDREAFGRMLGTMLRALMLMTTPLLAVATGLIPWIVAFLYTNRWAPAIPAFYGFAARMLGGNITTPLIAALNALGRPRDSLKILTVWTASDWAAALLLTSRYGFTGVALAYGVSVWIPVAWLIGKLAANAPVNWTHALVRPIVAGGITLLVLRALARPMVSDLPSLCAVAGLGILLYGAVLLVLERGTLLAEIRASRRALARAWRSWSENAPAQP